MAADSSFVQKALFGGAAIPGIPANAAILFLRLTAGLTIGSAGLDKIPVPEWMVSQVAQLRFPLPDLFALLVCHGEFLFGALLTLGMLTRISALFLAVTIGVAAFAFHGLTPIVAMHITQYLFWIFLFFTIVGPGSFSLDALIRSGSGREIRWRRWMAVPLIGLLIGVGAWKELTPPVVVPPAEVKLESLGVAGTFNAWDPTANVLSPGETGVYAATIEFDRPGPIEFKFAANGSWDLNFGEMDQSSGRFPVRGTAERDAGGSAANIRAFIPERGAYLVTFDTASYAYSLESKPGP